MPSPSKKGSKTPLPNKNQLLYAAAIACDKGQVNHLLASGANVNWANPESSNNTPLIAAIAINCSINLVEMLIDAGADVNKVNDVNETPIFVAALIGNPALVDMLIKAKADVKIKDKSGNSPLHLVAQAEIPTNMAGYLEIIDMILAKGEKINVQNPDKMTPLHIAASRGNTDIAERLIMRGANIHAINADKSTPLHIAAQYDMIDTVNLLLAKGADITKKNRLGVSASTVARALGNLEVADIIEKWPVLSTIAVMEDGLPPHIFNSMDLGSIQDMAEYRGKTRDNQYQGGKRKTRGKRITGKKTRSNRR
jgi:ankyrin repeat protein